MRTEFNLGTGVLTQYEEDIPLTPENSIFAAVSPRQIRQALTLAGLRGVVETAINSSDQDTKDWYEFATGFERDHPKVVELSIALNISEEDVDSLFRLASSL